ncbi:MAG: acylneuraminate cytidylyltransferase family protein [Alphaproteobacteria bacterium]
MDRILTVVPARGGSKGVPGKNLRPLAGLPLIAHVLRAAAGSKFPMRLLVSTDSPEIAEVARAHGAEAPFLRPAELAGDEVPVTPAIQHAARFLDEQGWRADIVLSLQPTNPLTETRSIDGALGRMIADPAIDSVVSATLIRKYHPFRAYRLEADGRLGPLTEYTSEEFLQKQDRPPAYGLTGAIFLRRRNALESWAGSGFALGSRIAAQIVSEEEAVDIDSEVDFLVAEAILAHRRREDAA